MRAQDHDTTACDTCARESARRRAELVREAIELAGIGAFLAALAGFALLAG